MFGYKPILCYYERNLDEKNRLNIPLSLEPEEDDEIYFVKEDNHLTVYSCDTLDRIFKVMELQMQNALGSDINLYHNLANEMSFLSLSILGKSTIKFSSGSCRITIPADIAKEFNLKGNLILRGLYDRLAIFNGEESYKEYENKVKYKKRS